MKSFQLSRLYRSSRAIFAALLLLTTLNVARAEKPEIDCSQIRGVCYNPTPADQARRELAYGKRVNLNAVRFWMSQSAYEKRGDAYLQDIVKSAGDRDLADRIGKNFEALMNYVKGGSVDINETDDLTIGEG